MAAANSALIVGGGPAGLATAIALRHAGVERVTVIERGRPSDVIGSELSLAGPMLRALDTLGVADRAVELGVSISEARFRSMTGDVVATQPLGAPPREGLPPMVGITRPNLHRLLADAVEGCGATLLGETTWETIEPGGDGVHVRLSNGSAYDVDLLVGADGVDSQVRETWFPEAPRPEFVGQAAWRARVPRRSEGILEAYYGPRAKPGLITVSAEHSYLFCLVTVTEFKRLPREQFPELLREELADFGGGIADVRDDIVEPDHIHYSPLTPVMVPPPWHHGRVVLVGDAVHATTPHLGYGAGLAVEDAVVLGEEIGGRASIDEALDAFTQRRYERCRMVVDNGVQLSRWEQHPDDPDADFFGLTGSSFAALAAPI
jgi:2-polyprenyl-6-methoxyphenol hydroxylase-like FAD-dependent oxidoreductase